MPSHDFSVMGKRKNYENNDHEHDDEGNSLGISQKKFNTCVKYLKASTTGVIISLYASICISQMQENIIYLQ